MHRDRSSSMVPENSTTLEGSFDMKIRTSLALSVAALTLTVTNPAFALQEDATPVSDKVTAADDLLENLKSAPLLPENSHNEDAQPVSYDGIDLEPTRASIVLPVAALQIPSIAAGFSPVAIDPESGVALGGYDPVGYFTQGEAIQGNQEITATYNGAIYYFDSDENRELFLADSERYTPAYGGYCTETLAHGALTPASPNHWTIHGDRLYLTRSAQSTKVLREKRAQSFANANEFWNSVDESLNIPNASSKL